MHSSCLHATTVVTSVHLRGLELCQQAKQRPDFRWFFLLAQQFKASRCTRLATKGARTAGTHARKLGDRLGPEYRTCYVSLPGWSGWPTWTPSLPRESKFVRGEPGGKGRTQHARWPGGCGGEVRARRTHGRQGEVNMPDAVKKAVRHREFPARTPPRVGIVLFFVTNLLQRLRPIHWRQGGLTS